MPAPTGYWSRRYWSDTNNMATPTSSTIIQTPISSIIPTWTVTVPSITATTIINPIYYWDWERTRHMVDWQQIHHPIDQRMVYVPASPAIVRRLSDQELYQQAVRDCNEQEAMRLRLLIAEREQQNAARQRTIIEENQRRENAKQCARELLLEHLNPQQRQSFERNGWFIVEGGKSKTRYRINALESMVANIDVFDKRDRPTHRLCGHVPTHKVPLGDQLLAQKMMLEYAEDDFLRIANRH